MRVLHVDDSRVILSMVRAVLEAAQIEVVSVTSAEDALKALAHDSFSLLITDLMMPGVSGVELVQRVRRSPHTALLPIIVCSTVQHREAVQDVISCGIQDYIIKPFKGPKLAERVVRAVREATSAPIADPDAAMLELGIVGGREAYAEMLRAFVAEGREALREVYAAFTAGDLSAVPVLSTRIQGAAAGLAIPTIERAAAKLTASAESGDMELVARYWAELDALLWRVDTYAGELGAPPPTSPHSEPLVDRAEDPSNPTS